MSLNKINKSYVYYPDRFESFIDKLCLIGRDIDKFLCRASAKNLEDMSFREIDIIKDDLDWMFSHFRDFSEDSKTIMDQIKKYIFFPVDVETLMYALNFFGVNESDILNKYEISNIYDLTDRKIAELQYVLLLISKLRRKNVWVIDIILKYSKRNIIELTIDEINELSSTYKLIHDDGSNKNEYFKKEPVVCL